MTLVVGADIGGTATRALVASVDGRRHGSGRGAGGNPTTHGEAAAGALLAALRQALAGVDPRRVAAGTLGCAGAGRLDADPATRAAFDAAWRQAGLTCPYTLVGDALVGFAAGTPAPDGTVVIAGTGAIAAAVRGHRLGRCADGHGWLLGDDGSGFWLGRQAVRATLADLDAHHPPGRIARLVLAEVLGTEVVAPDPRHTVDAVVQRINAGPPVALAALAPLVLAACRDGDPVAADLLDVAAARLVRTVGRVRPAGVDTPIVLAGGLLAADTPLAARVRAACAATWPAAPLPAATDGAAAAAWLAARQLPGVDPVGLHVHLVAEGAPSP